MIKIAASSCFLVQQINIIQRSLLAIMYQIKFHISCSAITFDYASLNLTIVTSTKVAIMEYTSINLTILVPTIILTLKPSWLPCSF